MYRPDGPPGALNASSASAVLPLATGRPRPTRRRNQLYARRRAATPTVTLSPAVTGPLRAPAAGAAADLPLPSRRHRADRRLGGERADGQAGLPGHRRAAGLHAGRRAAEVARPVAQHELERVGARWRRRAGHLAVPVEAVLARRDLAGGHLLGLGHVGAPH